MINLVVGATGNVGREVVRALLAEQHPVRALTRHPPQLASQATEVEVAVGDLNQPETLVPALQGVKAVFLLAGGDDNGTEQMYNVLDAVGDRRDLHIVLLSTLGASDPQVELARNHARRETLLRESGLSWSIVRPSTFMSNTGRWAPTIRQAGKVFNPTGDGQTATVAPEDIGAVAARAMQGGVLSGQILEVTGPELISTPEQVTVLSQVLGRPIECVEIPVEVAVRNMLRAGLPPAVAESLGTLTERIRSGRAAVQTSTVPQVLGRPAMTFKAWAAAHRQLWA